MFRGFTWQRIFVFVIYEWASYSCISNTEEEKKSTERKRKIKRTGCWIPDPIQSNSCRFQFAENLVAQLFASRFIRTDNTLNCLCNFTFTDLCSPNHWHESVLFADFPPSLKRFSLSRFRRFAAQCSNCVWSINNERISTFKQEMKSLNIKHSASGVFLCPFTLDATRNGTARDDLLFLLFVFVYFVLLEHDGALARAHTLFNGNKRRNPLPNDSSIDCNFESLQFVYGIKCFKWSTLKVSLNVPPPPSSSPFSLFADDCKHAGTKQNTISSKSIILHSVPSNHFHKILWFRYGNPRLDSSILQFDPKSLRICFLIDCFFEASWLYFCVFVLSKWSQSERVGEIGFA